MVFVLGNLSRLYVEVEGYITLVFQDKSSLTLKDYVNFPKLRRNLIATYCFYEDGYHTYFSDRVSILKNNGEICKTPTVFGVYKLRPQALVKPPKSKKKLDENNILRNPTLL